MTCANCEVLREKIHDLEYELGVRMQAGAVNMLIRELGLRPLAARAVMLLYQAKGRFIPTERLLTGAGFGSEGALRSTLYWARQTLGADMIASSYGAGYRLTDSGMAVVAGVLG